MLPGERLTDEHERIGDVVIAHVDDRGANPGAYARLGTVQDGMHHPRRFRRRLDPVQTLTSVTEPIGNIGGQKILLCVVPKLEHVCQKSSTFVRT